MQKESMLIRNARESDLLRITEIYNQAIRAKYCTCDSEEQNLTDRKKWFEIHNNAKTPVFVCEREGFVAGYAYLSLYREGRPVVKDTAEISYYVDFSFHGAGMGKSLVEYTVKKAYDLGYKFLVAILLSCNERSVRLLNNAGFKLWGSMEDIAEIDGKRYSHLYYGKRLDILKMED